MTSHDVVARCRRLMATRRVGHAGTLDPMATGVLLVGVGRATRLLTFLVGADKTYEATVRLGQATLSDDAEGEVVAAQDASGLTRSAIDAAVAALTGPIQQVPSAVSAIKVGGRRSYARVRAGESVELAARPVVVRRFEVVTMRPGPLCDIDIRVEVSSGTYVRALARDLGGSLGVGGHLTALRRTAVGAFSVESASRLDALETMRPSAQAALTPMAEVARTALPPRELSAQEASDLGYGRPLLLGDGTAGETAVAAFAPDGTLVAVLDESGERAVPRVVLAPAP